MLPRGESTLGSLPILTELKRITVTPIGQDGCTWSTTQVVVGYLRENSMRGKKISEGDYSTVRRVAAPHERDARHKLEADQVAHIVNLAKFTSSL